MKSALIKNLPILGITLLVFLIAFLNYKPGTILTGGDNLQIEFDFILNIKRALFSGWQEYQGVGLLGGMGHASDLFRQLFLLIVSPLIPNESSRFFWTICTLFLGSIGMYLLLGKIKTDHFSIQKPYRFLGALLYILNLATVQTYFFPFEVFTTHFAALPWLFYGVVGYFQQKSVKNLLLLAVIFLLTTSQGYVPTLFIVFVVSLMIILPFLSIQFEKKQSLKKKIMSNCTVLTLLLFINAFWLFPFLLFPLTSSEVNINAKINQMATETIYLQNKEFGNITDVMLLQGFWLNAVDPNLQQVFTYSLQPWRNYIQSPFVSPIGYLIFGVVLFGVITSLRKKQPLLLGLTAIFLFAFTMLTTNTPPFEWINDFLRKIPLISQIFRFPFTKFSLLLAFCYSIFFAIGAQVLLSRINKRIFIWLGFAFFMLLPIIFVFPIFQGKLFSERQQIAFPKEYRELFSYFKTHGKDTRIANFPQHTFWSWNYYNFGYAGSGFLWYGIEQPIMDRAFDPWSSYNENYYFAVADALYAKDSERLNNIFQKYQISYLIVDKNIIYPLSPKSLYTNELREILKDIPTVKKEKTFGNIDVYSVALFSKPKSFIYTVKNPSVVTASSKNNDKAFFDLGTYITSDTNSQASSYPFQNLFSNKDLAKDALITTENSQSITFTSLLLPSKTWRDIIVPSLSNTETMTPAEIFIYTNEDSSKILSLRLISPKVFLNKKELLSQELVVPLFELPTNLSTSLILSVNESERYSIDEKSTTLGNTLLSFSQDNIIVLSNPKNNVSQTQIVPGPSLKSLPLFAEKVVSIPPSTTKQTLSVGIPKITDSYFSAQFFPEKNNVKNCDLLRKGSVDIKMVNSVQGKEQVFSSVNQAPCIAYNKSTLPHEQGYIAFVKAENISGRGFHFWIINEDSRLPIIDVYLSKKQKKSSFILPRQEKFGTGYSFHLENMSIGKMKTENIFRSINLYPIPYSFLSDISTRSQGSTLPVPEYTYAVTSVDHPNESLYVVDLNPKRKSSLLILSQGYNWGWKAYETNNSFFPFFGKELKDHVLVNSWSNGWNLNNSAIQHYSNKTIVLIFWPQYIEYFGFLLLIVTFGILIFFTAKAHWKLKLDKKNILW